MALASEVAAEEAAGALTALGADARYFRHDVREVGAVAGLLDRVEAEMGPVVSLVSNAGVPAKVRGDMLEMTRRASTSCWA